MIRPTSIARTSSARSTGSVQFGGLLTSLFISLQHMLCSNAILRGTSSRSIQRSDQISRHIQNRHWYSKMAPLTAWDRLVRYVSAKDGKIRYGEPIVSDSKPDIDQLAQDGKLEVKILEGANPIEAKPTGEQDSVKQLLGPLTPKDVPIIRCIGLNYKTHSRYLTPEC